MAIIAGREVATVNIRGKEYPTVATRVQLAHHEKGIATGFSMVGNEVVSIEKRHFVRITLKIGDHLFSGTAEIHFGLQDKSADATNPLETAETSAVGRALAFAGYMVDTIASADEMAEAGRVRVIESEPAQIASPRYLSLDCAALAKELGLTEADYKLKVRSYTSPEGKIAWQSVWSALSTMKAERTLVPVEATATA